MKNILGEYPSFFNYLHLTWTNLYIETTITGNDDF